MIQMGKPIYERAIIKHAKCLGLVAVNLEFTKGSTRPGTCNLPSPAANAESNRILVSFHEEVIFK
jgi:hypothetical protein